MKNKLYIIGCMLGALLSLTQCDQYFEADTDDILLDDKYITSVNEFYAGFMGVASKVQAIADHAILVEGLRSDMLEPTANAPQDLWDIYRYQETNGNSYADPTGYYAIINNANIFINKANEYNKKNPGAIDQAIYEGLVSGALRYKMWAYIMLGKLYNEVIFFDEPLTEFQNIDGFDRLYLTDGSLMNQLQSQMLKGMLLEDGNLSVGGRIDILWDDLLYPDALSANKDLTWNMICPLPEMIMLEIYLWNQNYEGVITLAMDYLYEEGIGDKRNKMLTDKDYNAEWKQFWTREPVSKTAEVINVVPFEYEEDQVNRLLDYFSNTGTGSYFLKPTQVAMDRFYDQIRYDGATPFDRYRGEGVTFGEENGEVTAMKYTLGRTNEIYQNDPHIILYRASDVHLWLSEALIATGRLREADAFLNKGVQNYLATQAGKYEYPLDNGVTNEAFSLNWGVRRRVDLNAVYPETYSMDEIEAASGSSQDDMTEVYIQEFEELLVEEACMESALEARSLFAMIRIALKQNNPAIIADRVSAKYDEGERESIRQLLMSDQNSWFLNFDLNELAEK